MRVNLGKKIREIHRPDRPAPIQEYLIFMALIMIQQFPIIKIQQCPIIGTVQINRVTAPVSSGQPNFSDDICLVTLILDIFQEIF